MTSFSCWLLPSFVPPKGLKLDHRRSWSSILLSMRRGRGTWCTTLTGWCILRMSESKLSQKQRHYFLDHSDPHISSYGIKTSPRTSPTTPSRRIMPHIPQQIRFFDAIYHISYIICHIYMIYNILRHQDEPKDKSDNTKQEEHAAYSTADPFFRRQVWAVLIWKLALNKHKGIHFCFMNFLPLCQHFTREKYKKKCTKHHDFATNNNHVLQKFHFGWKISCKREMNTNKPPKKLQMNHDEWGKPNNSMMQLTPVSVVSAGSAVRRPEPLCVSVCF